MSKSQLLMNFLNAHKKTNLDTISVVAETNEWICVSFSAHTNESSYTSFGYYDKKGNQIKKPKDSIIYSIFNLTSGSY